MRLPKPLALVVAALLAVSIVTATQLPDRGPDLILIQSELDHLAARDVLVELEFDEAPPEMVFQAIASASGVEIELKGRFPDTTRVTIDLARTSLKDALTRLARDYHVYYKVPRPAKLVVIVEAEKPSADRT